MTLKSFLANVLRLIKTKAYHQDLSHFLTHQKTNISVKLFPKLLFATGVAHDAAYAR